MAVTQELSFELHEDMMTLISQEFSPAEISKKLAEAVQEKTQQDIESAGERIFNEYGMKWGQRTVELGESYMDRTYEILKESIEQTGSPVFPLVPQRFIEIAYLGTQEISTLPVIENNYRRLIYRIENCKTYQGIIEACGEDTAKLLTCRHGCLKLCQSIMEALQIEGVNGEISAKTSENGYCEFTLQKTT